MTQSLESALAQYLRDEQLPAAYLDDVRRYYLPLGAVLARLEKARNETLVVGVQGGQGTGKSTLARLLGLILSAEYGLRVAELSLDDIYLTRDERHELAQTVHPLLATRGVPGTHDIELGLATLNALREARDGDVVVLPRFDKSRDDRRPRKQWDAVAGPVDIVVLEGWCLGAPPQEEEALVLPINRLEADEDPDGRWRRYVNAQLGTSYRELFARLDFLLLLEAPSFESIYRWRGLQEEKLAARSDGSRVMNTTELAHFIQHYERLTRHCLSVLPTLADKVYLLDEAHQLRGEQ